MKKYGPSIKILGYQITDKYLYMSQIKDLYHSYEASPNETVESPTAITDHSSVSGTCSLKPIEFKSFKSRNWMKNTKMKILWMLKGDGCGEGQFIWWVLPSKFYYISTHRN